MITTELRRLTLPEGLADALSFFLLALEAQNVAPRTRASYEDAVRLFSRFLTSRGMPQDPASITREHVETFIRDQLEHWRPATALNRYRALARFFRFLEGEGLIGRNPMARMKPPRLSVEPVPLLAEEHVRRLLKACEGTSLEDRRDMALVLFLIDTGCRRAEIAELRLDDLDTRTKMAQVVGKGSRPHTVTFGPRAALAVQRYLLVRKTHRDHERPHLWLGLRGPITSDGIAEILARRSRLAAIPRVRPHAFRHLSAHYLMAQGMAETEIMKLFGWSSRQMFSRYAASTQTERALASYRRLPAPSERF